MKGNIVCVHHTASVVSSQSNNVNDFSERAQEMGRGKQEATDRLTSCVLCLRPTSAFRKSQRKAQKWQLRQEISQLQEQIHQLSITLDEQKRENLDLCRNMDEQKRENLDLCSSTDELNRQNKELRININQQNRGILDLRNNVAILQEARRQRHEACHSNFMLCLLCS